MIVNKVKYDLGLKMPSLEEAQKIVEKVYEKPVNSKILVLGIVAPEETTNGVKLSETIKREVQGAINKKGVLLVDFCESLNSNIQVSGIAKGKFVKIGPTEPMDLKLMKDDKGNKYIAMVFSAYDISTFVKEPEYNDDEVTTPKKNQGPDLTIMN